MYSLNTRLCEKLERLQNSSDNKKIMESSLLQKNSTSFLTKYELSIS